MQGRSPEPYRHRYCPAQARRPNRGARWEALRHAFDSHGAARHGLIQGAAGKPPRRPWRAHSVTWPRGTDRSRRPLHGYVPREESWRVAYRSASGGMSDLIEEARRRYAEELRYIARLGSR